MTPKEFSEIAAKKIQEMPERAIINLGAADILMLGLLQNILGMLTITIQQNDEIIRRMPLPEEPKIITP